MRLVKETHIDFMSKTFFASAISATLLIVGLVSIIINGGPKLSIDFNKPIGNGVITALNMDQAIKRSLNSSSKKPNKGSEAANAVISIIKNGPKKI